ncbi:hypothetical protein JMJ77_0006802 [Colletotrichum scovillei]|uniref:Uncharacterized protein n=1 Tax=Colletotrichum scovillei TaxID=1209932 RepID=A0A9P7UIK4_9PEZI|nr:hypothetical protein JMJ77_0006802 [Colletotrichum scovillei]KAG7085206.1 hypothetical protein JMJ78_0010631 [Colletotrichum scovillei]
MAQPDLGHSVSSRPNKEHLNPSPMFQDHPSDTLSGSRQCSEVKMRIQDSSTSNAPPLALGRSGKAPNAPVRLGDGAARPHSILLLGAARPCSSAIALGKNEQMGQPRCTSHQHTSGTGFLAPSGFQMVAFAHGAEKEVQMANSTSISIPHFEIDEV